MRRWSHRLYGNTTWELYLLLTLDLRFGWKMNNEFQYRVRKTKERETPTRAFRRAE